MCVRNRSVFRWFAVALAAGLSCPWPAAAQENPAGAPRPVYESRGRRDPFVQPQAGRLRNVMGKVEIANLRLTGVISNPRRSLALFVSQTGPRFGYLLKNEKLYQENQQPVPGVTGRVYNSNQVVLQQDDKQIVFTLR
ncbi:MAG: hypothetical protein AB1439_08555 [candidate division FCPU426 bacterium]